METSVGPTRHQSSATATKPNRCPAATDGAATVQLAGEQAWLSNADGGGSPTSRRRSRRLERLGAAAGDRSVPAEGAQRGRKDRTDASATVASGSTACGDGGDGGTYDCKLARVNRLVLRCNINRSETVKERQRYKERHSRR